MSSFVRVRKINYPISVLSFDLDDLKKTNDSLGHSAGDALLKDCAMLINSSMRKDDVFARMGGDEFAIIFPSTTLEAAEKNLKENRREDYRLQQKSSGTKIKHFNRCCNR